MPSGVRATAGGRERDASRPVIAPARESDQHLLGPTYARTGAVGEALPADTRRQTCRRCRRVELSIPAGTRAQFHRRLGPGVLAQTPAAK